LVLGAWVISSWSFAWGVLVGGVISIASFWAAYRDILIFFKTLEPDQLPTAATARKTKTGLMVKFWLRLLLIGLILFLFIRFGGINIFGLILGLTTVVFAITFSALGVAWQYYFSRR
ncbi:MAG: ATP synthase subunit I, partial [Desulfofustis sp.]